MRPAHHNHDANLNSVCDRCHAYKPRHELAPTTCQLWIADSQVSLFMGKACFACRTTLTQIAGVGALKRHIGFQVIRQISKEKDRAHRSTRPGVGCEGVPSKAIETRPGHWRNNSTRRGTGRQSGKGIRTRTQSLAASCAVSTTCKAGERARAGGGAAHRRSQSTGQSSDSEEQGQLLCSGRDDQA